MLQASNPQSKLLPLLLMYHMMYHVTDHMMLPSHHSNHHSPHTLTISTPLKPHTLTPSQERCYHAKAFPHNTLLTTREENLSLTPLTLVSWSHVSHTPTSLHLPPSPLPTLTPSPTPLITECRYYSLIMYIIFNTQCNTMQCTVAEKGHQSTTSNLCNRSAFTIMQWNALHDTLSRIRVLQTSIAVSALPLQILHTSIADDVKWK